MKSNREDFIETSISAYLAEIRKNLAHGNATEHTHRPMLKTLIESNCAGLLKG